MVGKSRRGSSCPSQARLLQERGDLQGKRSAFKVKLEKPNPLALQAENPFDRLGMGIKRGAVPDRLVVAEVDVHPRKKTPVALWNLLEERNADRAEEEQHASLAILPGDRLKSVNNVNGKTRMLAELVESADYHSPKALSLAISRNLSDIMAPSPERPAPRCIATAPAKLPRCCPENDSVANWTIPPRQRRYSNSRAASAGSLRSCSGTKHGSTHFSVHWDGSVCRSGPDVSVSLSNAGRYALAF